MTWLEKINVTIKNIRLFYKSYPLFFQTLKNYRSTWWLPLLGAGTFFPRQGEQPIHILKGYWTMLPTACRLSLIGAHPEWVEGKMKITFQGFCFFAPGLEKSPAIYLKDIYIDDVYRLDNLDLRGKTVLDVGANIGDTSIALASRGAKVHAFEPLSSLSELLGANVRINRLEDRIVVHPVGLGRKDEVIPVENDKLVLVEAIRYLKSQGLAQVDLIKLDCEGCEYHLLEHRDFLSFLQPRWIICEYHHGGAAVQRRLSELGYAVDWPEREDPVGYLYASRRT
ncbi:MAG: FkbM family methyltransferase [Syntrophales bacterium]|nr:FkbM family methyltransferase [Syntrophales bacterium]